MLPKRNVTTLIGELKRCAERGAANEMGGLIHERNIAVLFENGWSPSAFLATTDLLRSESFLRLARSWKLVHSVDLNWEMLSASQQTALRDILVATFDKHADFMGAFVIGEMLGRRYGDAQALEVLSGLAVSAALPARALVPHGLETLAREGALDIRDAALDQLRSLLNSSTEEVRAEAAECLERVNRALRRDHS